MYLYGGLLLVLHYWKVISGSTCLAYLRTKTFIQKIRRKCLFFTFQLQYTDNLLRFKPIIPMFSYISNSSYQRFVTCLNQTCQIEPSEAFLQLKHNKLTTFLRFCSDWGHIYLQRWIILTFILYFYQSSTIITSKIKTIRVKIQKPGQPSSSEFVLNYQNNPVPLNLFWTTSPNHTEAKLLRKKSASKKFSKKVQHINTLIQSINYSLGRQLSCDYIMLGFFLRQSKISISHELCLIKFLSDKCNIMILKVFQKLSWP